MKHSFLSCPSTNNRGLTLVEVLLTVTIFAVIAVSVAGAFFSGLRLWDRVKSVDFVRMSFFIDIEKVARDMRQAMDVPLIGFEGDAVSYSFPGMEKDALVRITYYFDLQNNALMRKTQDLTSIQDERSEDTGLATKVFDADPFAFRYLTLVDNTPDWAETWQKEKGIVRAVRLEGVSHGEPFSKIIIIPVGE